MNKAMGRLTLTDADGLAQNTDDDVYVVLSITRKEIEACDFTSALERLLVLIDTEQNVRRYRESLVPRRPPKLPHLWPPKLLHLAGVS